MMHTLARFLSIAALAAVTACGGGGDGGPDDMDDDIGDDGDDGDDGEGDETAPEIVSMSPVPGATGQRDDMVVTISFSEPMDKGSVEGTLDTEDLGEVALDWNAPGDTITITPLALLDYAEGAGDDPSDVTALKYAVTLGSAAKDLAGNPLGAGVTIDFSTLKRMETVADLKQDMTRSLTPALLVYDADDPLVVGDDDEDGGVRAAITFDLATLSESAVDVTAATLATRQLPGEQWGEPYADLGDSMMLDHVTFNSLVSESAINAAFNASQVSMTSHEGFAIDEQVVIEFDVTDEVADDLAERVFRQDRSQFLLWFQVATDLNDDWDRAVISRDLMELQVTYLAP